jgi:hypothetical protein
VQQPPLELGDAHPRLQELALVRLAGQAGQPRVDRAGTTSVTSTPRSAAVIRP